MNLLKLLAFVLCFAATALNAQNVTIPDIILKAYLVGNPAINTNGDSEIQLSEATAFTGSINCSRSRVSDLTGIETFVNLTYLNCYGNPAISSIDVSQNTKLTDLWCGENAISSIDISQNPDLVNFTCSDCLLTSLNAKNGNNANFTYFDVENNSNLSCIEVDAPALIPMYGWLTGGASFSTNCPGPPINVVAIPDANFKAYLVGNAAINTNGDSEIQISEATAFTGTISCAYSYIENFTGLEAFVNLTALNISGNPLISTFDCSLNTSLTSLNASSCVDLYSLGALPVSLVSLTCYGSDLYGLNVTQNINLVSLNCSGNSMTSLDVSQNVNLVSLSCGGTDLSSLDVSQNTNLVSLSCSYMTLNSLDLSQNTNLTTLDCSESGISSLDLRNGNNTIITSFDATNYTLQCIDVDDVAYSTSNWTNIHSGTSFSTNCSGAAPIVSIPDANFKAYLLGNTAINTDGDTEIQVTEATAFTGTINCSNLSISDLTGLEAFVNLAQLRCYSNSINNLDISQNTSLTQLYCYANNLSSLDVSQNTNLIVLHCANNSISNLDVSQNTNLTQLFCTNNQLSHLDVGQNINLKKLYVNTNQLSSLDVRNGNNTNLTHFDARTNSNLTCIQVDNSTYSTNNWTNIDVIASFNTICTLSTGPAPIVTIPDANFKAYLVGNTAINTDGDTEIQVTEATAFTGTINCSNLSISDLTGLEAFVNLAQLRCYSNSINNLNLSQNTSLTQLYCYANNLSSLDVSQNTNLIVLHCANNSISNLDVSQNTNLTQLFCTNNQLTTLNVTQNTNLRKLYVNLNQLSSLDVRNGNNTNITHFDARANSSLSCIEVDDVAYSTSNWTNIDSGTGFSTSNCNGSLRIVTTSGSTMQAAKGAVDLSSLNLSTTGFSSFNLRAYPNPTTKEITLDFGKTYQEANIQITNLTGQVVLTKTIQSSSNTTLELEGAAGVYFVNIQTEEGRAILKIIKE